MGEMKHPRLWMMAGIWGIIVFATWGGMAYERGDIGWYIGFCVVVSVFASFVYFHRIPPTSKEEGNG